MSGLDSSQRITEDVVSHASEYHVHSRPGDAEAEAERDADDSTGRPAAGETDDVEPS